jgi:hypothetical protein
LKKQELQPEKKIVYLASPYTDPSPDVEEARYQEALKAAAYLTAQGYKVFSPIVHCHPIRKQYDLPGDWNYWKEYDEAFLSISKKMFIYQLDGWKQSKGLSEEVILCNQLGVSMVTLDPEEVEDWYNAVFHPTY